MFLDIHFKKVLLSLDLENYIPITRYELLYIITIHIMKPLQFYQKKNSNDWLSLRSTYSITGIELELEKIRKMHPLTRRTMRTQVIIRKTAELLYEYYSILFSQKTSGK